MLNTFLRYVIFVSKGAIYKVYCAECSKMEVLEFNKLRFMPKRYNLPQALLQSLCAPKSVYTYKYTNTILIHKDLVMTYSQGIIK